MRSRIAGRRVLTAGGIYLSAVLGFLGQILAARWLGPEDYGVLAIVIAVTGFVQLVTDLTVEEAVVKYGFRYVHGEQWGRLRRLFGRALRVKLLGSLGAAVVIAALAPAGRPLFGHSGLLVPLLVAALLPVAQAGEGLAGVALLLRSRYDIRSFFLVVGMATRFVALVVGSRMGVTETVVFVVLAQVLTTSGIAAVGLVAFRRFPQLPHEPLGEDRADIVRFMKQSAVASTMSTFQSAVAPVLLGLVTNPVQVGLFRVAMAPQTALAAISSPIRLILLTEQTRDWERGDIRTVFAGLRRYTLASLVLSAVAVPPLVVFLPDLVRIVYGEEYAGAGNAARIIFVASMLLFVIGWSKSLPVSIGRPALRIWTHGAQAVVLIPATLLLGWQWRATGGAWAFGASSVAFVALWAVIVVRLHREHRGALSAAPREEPA